MRIIVGVCAFKKKYYNSDISCVEIQRTFYNIPQEKTIKKWREEAPNSFIFNIKGFQGFTHGTKLPTWRRYARKITNELQDKAGNLKVNDLTLSWMKTYATFARILRSPVIVIQTPSSFRPTDENVSRASKFFETFSEIVEQIAPNTYIGWEPRGKWLESKQKLEFIIRNNEKLIHIVDPFYHKPIIVKNISYFRLHGKPYLNYKYRYTREDLKLLLGKIKDLSSDIIYVLFNNTYMETNAIELMGLIGVQS